MNEANEPEEALELPVVSHRKAHKVGKERLSYVVNHLKGGNPEDIVLIKNGQSLQCKQKKEGQRKSNKVVRVFSVNILSISSLRTRGTQRSWPRPQIPGGSLQSAFRGKGRPTRENRA